ncbi:MAG: hypothetical protein M1503_03550 [Thaumarchaeota archaeon]|nr:hypothetical protein [Nitrososphaerota archaeon]MCL5317328.1 hypothetical protein [Nitrososphaerota archaeon]
MSQDQNQNQGQNQQVSADDLSQRLGALQSQIQGARGKLRAQVLTPLLDQVTVRLSERTSGLGNRLEMIKLGGQGQPPRNNYQQGNQANNNVDLASLDDETLASMGLQRSANVPVGFTKSGAKIQYRRFRE